MPLAARASAIGLALALAVTAAALLRMSARRTAPPAVLGEIDIPPIPGNVARTLAFGFRSLIADLTLLQAIQVLPVRHGDMPPDHSLRSIASSTGVRPLTRLPADGLRLLGP